MNLLTSVILIAFTSAAYATENPNLNITAYGKLKSRDNVTTELEISDGEIQIEASPEKVQVLELRCTAFCPIRWKFQPAKDTKHLSHIFGDIKVESEKMDENSLIYTKSLVINSASSEMTGMYSCECDRNSSLNTEVYVYWQEWGQGSPLVNAGLELITLINPRGWTKLPCGSFNSSQKLFLYTRRDVKINRTFKEMKPMSSIVQDRRTGFLIDFRNLPLSAQQADVWICTSQNYGLGVLSRNTIANRIVRTQLYSNDDGKSDPKYINSGDVEFNYSVSNTNYRLECCSHACQDCTDLKEYKIPSKDTADLFKPFLRDNITGVQICQSNSSVNCTQGRLYEARKCQGMDVSGNKDMVGFAVQCTATYTDLTQKRKAEYYYIPFNQPLRDSVMDQDQTWVIPVAVSFITIFVIFLKLLHKYKKQNPEIEKLRRKFFKGDPTVKSAPQNELSNPSQVQYTRNRALALPYSRKKWEYKRENWEYKKCKDSGKKNELGGGISGVVSEATLRLRTGEKISVAIKKIKNDIKTRSAASIQSSFEFMLNEIKIMIAIQELPEQHPNIITFIGANTSGFRRREIFIILELCGKQNLGDYLKEPNNRIRLISADRRSVSPMVFKWCAEIAAGLEFLSQNNFLHSDVAPRNILLTDEPVPVAKIADFGLSKSLYKNGAYLVRDEQVLPAFAALEGFDDVKNGPRHFTVKSDIWSFGHTLHEIFSLGRRMPVGAQTKPLYCDIMTFTMIQRCWAETPDLRPSFSLLREYFEHKHRQSLVREQAYVNSLKEFRVDNIRQLCSSNGQSLGRTYRQENGHNMNSGPSHHAPNTTTVNVGIEMKFEAPPLESKSELATPDYGCSDMLERSVGSHDAETTAHTTPDYGCSDMLERSVGSHDAETTAHTTPDYGCSDTLERSIGSHDTEFRAPEVFANFADSSDSENSTYTTTTV